MLLPYESKLGCRWHLEAKSQFADVVWEKTLQQNWSCGNYRLTAHTSEEDAQCPICAWNSTQCCWGSRSQYHSEIPFTFAMLADASVCVERLGAREVTMHLLWKHFAGFSKNQQLYTQGEKRIGSTNTHETTHTCVWNSILNNSQVSIKWSEQTKWDKSAPWDIFLP